MNVDPWNFHPSDGVVDPVALTTTPHTEGVTMHPAEYLAALKAMKAGLDDQIREAETAVLALAETTGAERLTTPYGPITVARRAGGIGVVDTAAFTAWCEANLPDAIEVIRQVRPQTAKAAMSRLTMMRGVVFDTVTGEEVSWAAPTEPGDPYCTWPASNAQKDAKDMARLLFADRAEILASGLRELTGGEAAT